MPSWRIPRPGSAPHLVALTVALVASLGLMPGPATRPSAIAQTAPAQTAPAQTAPAAGEATAAPAPASPRTLREKRADGVTVSIPHDLVRNAPGGAAMGYTDSTQGGGWVEPPAMALGYVSPSAGSRGNMPGPNATVGPTAGTAAINPLPYQAFSRSSPDAAVNSAPSPADVGRPELLQERIHTSCGMTRNYFGC